MENKELTNNDDNINHIDEEILDLNIDPVTELNDSTSEDALQQYFKSISAYKPYSHQEEIELGNRIQQGDKEALKKLILANLKFVVSIANKYKNLDVPLLDLINQGNIGLLEAAKRYDPSKGTKFITYAVWWIKQAMFKAISEQSNCMKIPVYIQETLSKFSKIKREMEYANNCQVKTEDVAKKMNISADKIDTFLNAYTKTISIEGFIENNDGKNMSVADVLEDEKASATHDVEFENLRNDILNVISTLKEREQQVVKMRYGLDDTDKMTLEEIGNIYGVTKECIRQTELRALNKM